MVNKDILLVIPSNCSVLYIGSGVCEPDYLEYKSAKKGMVRMMQRNILTSLLEFQVKNAQ